VYVCWTKQRGGEAALGWHLRATAFLGEGLSQVLRRQTNFARDVEELPFIDRHIGRIRVA
jgi:hypothetical protein